MVEIGTLPFGMTLLADGDNQTAWIRIGRNHLVRPWEMKHWVGAQKIRDAVTRIAQAEEARCRKAGIPIYSDLRCAAALHASVHMNPDLRVGFRRYGLEVGSAR